MPAFMQKINQKARRICGYFLGNAGLLKVNSKRFENNALGLVLYDRKLNSIIRAEGLSIVSQNKITDINCAGRSAVVSDVSSLIVRG